MRIYAGLLLGVMWIACCACAPAPATDARRAKIAGASTATSAAAGAAIAQVAMTSTQLRRDTAIDASIANTAAAEQWQRDYQIAIQQHVQRLLATPDARSQLLAALLMHVDTEPSPERAQALAAQALADAARLDPDDTLVAWLQAMQCYNKTPGCDAAAGRQRLLLLEPNNAANWLLAMEDALAHDDPQAVDRFLTRAAQAPRYDLHWNDSGTLLGSSLQQVALPPRTAALARWQGQRLGLNRALSDEDAAAIHAQAVYSAQVFPSYRALASVCGVKDGVLPPSARRSSCSAVFARMADSDTLIARQLGLNQIVQLSADAADGAAWRERLRAHHWLLARGLPRASQEPGYLSSTWRLGEMAALQALMARTGQAIPPPGWLPADPRNRALITTGRPPPRG